MNFVITIYADRIVNPPIPVYPQYPVYPYPQYPVQPQPPPAWTGPYGVVVPPAYVPGQQRPPY